MTDRQTLHIHLVSDSTGETVHQVARACVAQFPNVTTIEHVWTLVRSEAHLESLCAGLDRNPGVLLMSIVNDDMRDMIANACQSRGIPAVSILDPVVNLLGRVLGQTTQNLPGGQRRLNTAYFDRIAAVDFAVSHDDGMNMGKLDQADICWSVYHGHQKHPHLCIWRIAAIKLPIMHWCQRYHFHFIILMG